MATTNMSAPLINTIVEALTSKAGKAKSIKLENIKDVLEGLQIVPDVVYVKEDKKPIKSKGKKKSDGPKRIPTTYNLFMKAFLNTHNDDYENHKERFAAGSSAWSNTKDDAEAREALLKEYNIDVENKESDDVKEEKKPVQPKKSTKAKKSSPIASPSETPSASPSGTPPASPRRLPFPIDNTDDEDED